ncbi:hypothetical protein BDN72DRAFT_834416 [Pluteus cervinus]|uniref:Uncharacterized protein n=1 Tax=Pluteus cervinus TaxID=181527 RepID=A0ACD3B7J8_9AGAR|nr:hypothetical protein BDN72DRAFT_834416 [Pluteus cervinus]
MPVVDGCFLVNALPSLFAVIFTALLVPSCPSMTSTSPSLLLRPLSIAEDSDGTQSPLPTYTSFVGPSISHSPTPSSPSPSHQTRSPPTYYTTSIHPRDRDRLLASPRLDTLSSASSQFDGDHARDQNPLYGQDSPNGDTASHRRHELTADDHDTAPNADDKSSTRSKSNLDIEENISRGAKKFLIGTALAAGAPVILVGFIFYGLGMAFKGVGEVLTVGQAGKVSKRFMREVDDVVDKRSGNGRRRSTDRRRRSGS